jgi:hydrogenase maturation protease
MQGVCHFKLPSPEGLLADCLAGYKAAILIDSTKIGTLTGTISISDLSTMLERAVPLNIGSVHGFALADELRQAKRLKQLPARIIFFGLEVDALERTEDLTKVVEPKMLTSVKNASLLLETIVETLKKEACTIMLAETAQSAGSRVLN